MKKLLKGMALLVALAMLGTSFVACSDGGDDNEGSKPQIENSTPGDENNTPSDNSGSEVTEPVTEAGLFPANGSTDAYADTRLLIKFDAAPVISDEAKVVIKEGETVVDTINAKNEKLYSLGMSGVITQLNVRDQLMVVEGNILVVTAHNDSSGNYLLKQNKTYSVTVSGITGKIDGKDFDGISDWSFTTKSVAVISNNQITVGHSGTEQFYSIQGALEAIKFSGSSEKFTIKLSAGNYHERNFYNGGASLVIEGPAGNNRGEGTVIYFMNNNQWNNGTRDRVNFLWQGKDLTLKNVTLKSSFTRKEFGSQNADPTDGRNEVLNFDSKSNLAVYNSTFIATQDTLILGGNGGKAWFYNSVVQGDVDYIWGTLDVCLFEDCLLICKGGDTTASYIFASRTPTVSGVTGKGFILYNSDIKIDGIKAYFGRDMGSESQSAVIKCNVTTENGGILDSSLYLKASSKYVEDINGEVAVGFVDFGNTLNGEKLDTSNRLANTADMSERLVNREYNGRYAILNRSYNEITKKYVDSAVLWDVSTLAEEFGAPQDNSKENFYVEPVYSSNFVSGKTLQLTASEGVTYSSSNTEIATVDANTGLVTTVAGASGDVTITATSVSGRTDVSVLNVIAQNISATAVSIAVADLTVPQNGVTEATITFEPEDTSEKTVILTSSDSNVLFVDELKNNKLVQTLETSAAKVKIWVGGSNASLTVASKSYPAATTGTATIFANSAEKIWISAAAPLRMATDIQNGTAGLWDGLVINSKADGDVITTNGKMSFKLADRMQTRNVSLFIPVDGASSIEFMTTNPIANIHSIGEDKTEAFSAVAGKSNTYSYLYNGGKYGVVDGDNSVIPTTFAKKAGSDVSKEQKYLRVNCIGAGGEYLTYIKVTKTGDFNEEWNSTAPEITMTMDNSMVTLEKAGIYNRTATAEITGSTGNATITYSSNATGVATVDSETGHVMAVEAGFATITATATFEGAETKTKSYLVEVNPPVGEDYTWTTKTMGLTTIGTLQGKKGTILTMLIDATSGKFNPSTNASQCNSGTVLYIPMTKAGKIFVTTYNNNQDVDLYKGTVVDEANKLTTTTSSKTAEFTFTAEELLEVEGVKYAAVRYGTNDYLMAVTRTYTD